MRIFRAKLLWVLSAFMLTGAALAASAQNARLELKHLEKLSNKATEVNDITLEGEMLRLAIKALDMADDPDARQVKDTIKGLTGIYVKSFEFDKPNQYSQEDVAAIRAQLAGPGWTKIVESSSKPNNETSEIYLMKHEDKVAGVAILVAEPTELTVVNLVGSIDLKKLGELGGHFGIPTQEKPKAAPKGKQQKKESEVEEDLDLVIR